MNWLTIRTRGKATQIGAVHGGADVRFYCPLLVPYSSLRPTHFKIVCLFGLLGLALARSCSRGEP